MSIPEPFDARSAYLGFPLRVTGEGGRQAGRIQHIRELVLQALLTSPGERVFVEEFGIGAQRLVFAPMNETLWARIENRLVADLSDILQGDADTSSITVTARPDEGAGEVLRISISYRLIAIDRRESVEVDLAGSDMLDAMTRPQELS